MELLIIANLVLAVFFSTAVIASVVKRGRKEQRQAPTKRTPQPVARSTDPVTQISSMPTMVSHVDWEQCHREMIEQSQREFDWRQQQKTA